MVIGSLRQSNILNRVCYQCYDEDTVNLCSSTQSQILEDEVHALQVQLCPLSIMTLSLMLESLRAKLQMHVSLRHLPIRRTR